MWYLLQTIPRSAIEIELLMCSVAAVVKGILVLYPSGGSGGTNGGGPGESSWKTAERPRPHRSDKAPREGDVNGNLSSHGNCRMNQCAWVCDAGARILENRKPWQMEIIKKRSAVSDLQLHTQRVAAYQADSNIESCFDAFNTQKHISKEYERKTSAAL